MKINRVHMIDLESKVQATNRAFYSNLRRCE